MIDTIPISGNSPICISFNAPVSPATASPLMATMANAVNGGRDEIHLFLSTPGGTVADGIAVYNLIRALPVPVIIYNTGTVNSIGNVIYQAGARRICATVSSFMFHGVGFEIQNAHMEMKQIRERLEALKNDQSMIADIIVRHTGMGTEDVNRLFLEMAFVNAQEALQRRITDEVRDVRLPAGLPIQQLIFNG